MLIGGTHSFTKQCYGFANLPQSRFDAIIVCGDRETSGFLLAFQLIQQNFVLEPSSF